MQTGAESHQTFLQPALPQRSWASAQRDGALLGFAGLLAALACVRPADQKVDLFGFNWSPKSYYMHKMTSEELMV